MIEYEVDEIFEYDGNYLKIVACVHCTDCYFRTNLISNDCDYKNCLPNDRKDNQNIIYKFISKNDVRKIKLKQIENNIYEHKIDI